MPDRPMPPLNRSPSGTPPSGATPSTWADAFAALPTETPPADGWARTAARLSERRAPSPAEAFAVPATPRAAAAARSRWALAAMLAAALPLGLWLGLRAQRPLPDAAPSVAQQAASRSAVAEPRVPQAPASRPDAPLRDASRPDPAPAIAASARTNEDAGRLAAATTETLAGGNTANSPATPATAAATDASRIAASKTTPKPSRGARAEAGPQRRLAVREPRSAQARAVADAADPAITTAAIANAGAVHDGTASSAAASATAASTTVAATAAADAADTRLIAQLRELQAESAQLEALVAATRDDRVASAAAAVMSADLDQRLRLIDTALGDAALPAATRVALWRERVDSLRSLAGVESTQRWYAARGERYDGALVRVD